MPTGKENKRRTARGGTNNVRAKGLRFSRGRLIVELADRREVSVPLEWYPTLDGASSRKRARWLMLGGGVGFHWPDLDLDLSLAGVTQGLPQAIPRPPQMRRRRSA